MANGPSAGEALKAASDIPGLGIGVHLNIVRGRPLSPPANVRSLVGPEGRFFNSVPVLLLKSILGELREEEILIEYRAQVRFMLEKGFIPTHMDGEKHTHLLLHESRRVLDELRKEFSIDKVRTINERELHGVLALNGYLKSRNIRQELKLRILERASKKARASWKEFKTPDLFFGVLATGKLSRDDGIAALKAILSLKMSAVVEWMLHPGYPARIDPDFGKFFLSDARLRETEFLLSDEVKEEISKNQSQLISYGEI